MTETMPIVHCYLHNHHGMVETLPIYSLAQYRTEMMLTALRHVNADEATVTRE